MSRKLRGNQCYLPGMRTLVREGLLAHLQVVPCPSTLELPKMQREPVESSNIASIGYQAGPPAVLEIEFKGGGVYQYTSSDDKIITNHYNQLKLAESKGKHFTQHIRRDPAVKVQRVN